MRHMLHAEHCAPKERACCAAEARPVPYVQYLYFSLSVILQPLAIVARELAPELAGCFSQGHGIWLERATLFASCIQQARKRRPEEVS